MQPKPDKWRAALLSAAVGAVVHLPLLAFGNVLQQLTRFGLNIYVTGAAISLLLGGHPDPANGGHLKSGQRS